MRKKLEKSTLILNKGTLSKIEKQKRGRKFNLYIDDVLVFSIYEDTFIKFNLKKYQKLSKEKLHEIYEYDQLIKAVNSAYNLLSIRPRSKREIELRLSQRFSKEIVQKVTKELQRKQLIQDEDFCNFWVSSSNYKLKSKRQIEYELYQKNVDPKQIHEALNKFTEGQEIEKAKQLIRKYKSRYSEISEIAKKQKMQNLLARKGYTWSVIREVTQ
ncbi:RecX family transcriptional regulator [Patescibacteria group bacterium]